MTALTIGWRLLGHQAKKELKLKGQNATPSFVGPTSHVPRRCWHIKQPIALPTRGRGMVSFEDMLTEVKGHLLLAKALD